MNKTLIYDLETWVHGKIDPKKDTLRVFGAYSFLTKKYYILRYDQLKEINFLLKNHDTVVGFNNLQYDNVVLKHNDYPGIIQNNYGDCRIMRKTNVDLKQFFKLWAGSMKIEKGMLKDLLMRYSLDFISKTIGIVEEGEGKILDFDYNVLKKDKWTPEEWKYIYDYTIRDLEVTKKMYEWVENYMSGFKPFLQSYDVKTKKYLTSTPGVFAYKAICKKLNLKEEYDSETKSVKYGGGYVAYPAGESFEGNIYCTDFKSAYPHAFAQCNLYSTAPIGWSGNGVFKVNGVYNDKIMGKIEKLLMEFYNLRIVYKKNKDPREYSIKIIINIAYGLTGNPVFKHMFNPTTASDCTRLVRQWVKLARKKFNEAGFKVIYTDTDSVYLIADDKEKMLMARDEIIKIIKDNVPFPAPTFDMGIDDEISHMWFFKGSSSVSDDRESDKEMDEDDFFNKPLGFMKKNYIYLTKDGKVKVKNLGVMKKSTSALTRKVFWEHLIPKIAEEKKVKFPRDYFRKLIMKLLEEDLMIATTRYQVREFSEYKNPSQLQAQISKEHGEGIVFLIRNNKVGVGKGKKYCTINEFKENKLQLRDIDLSNVFRELNYFIEEEKVNDLSEWGII